jgi:hypothetical protein
LVPEGQREKECGQKTARTRWVVNDNGKKISDYGVTCWLEGGNRALGARIQKRGMQDSNLYKYG